MNVFDIDQIKRAVNLDNGLEMLINSQRQAFIDFSAGLYEVPLPVQLQFIQTHGDCHIKAGFRRDDDVFVIKIVTGFYKNTHLNLPAGDGALLVFCQKTGLLQAILCEGGFLTTLRTALAAVVSATLTPWNIRCIGIIGTGVLAALIQIIMKKRYPDAQLCLWGRSTDKARSMAANGVRLCHSVQELMEQSDLIITATASTRPIITAQYLSGNRHIIALGADDRHKQECDMPVFEKADLVIVDSLVQACKLGDTAHALRQQVVGTEKIVELGVLLQQQARLDAGLIITDLTGIAAQDIAIAKWVLQGLKANDAQPA